MEIGSLDKVTFRSYSDHITNNIGDILEAIEKLMIGFSFFILRWKFVISLLQIDDEPAKIIKHNNNIMLKNYRSNLIYILLAYVIIAITKLRHGLYYILTSESYLRKDICNGKNCDLNI